MNGIKRNKIAILLETPIKIGIQGDILYVYVYM